jgi:Trk-type K+ transport system membrane component
MIVAVLVIAIAASALALSHLTNERASFLRQRIPRWEVSEVVASVVKLFFFFFFFLTFFFLLVFFKHRRNWNSCVRWSTRQNTSM